MAITALAFAGDECVVTLSVAQFGYPETSVRNWHVPTGRQGDVVFVQGKDVTASLVVDERSVVLGCRDGEMLVVGLADRSLRSLSGHTNAISALALTEDKRLVSASADNTVKIWQLDTGLLLHDLVGHSGRITSVAVSNVKLISAADDCTLRAWDLNKGSLQSTLGGPVQAIREVERHNTRVSAVTFSSDGRAVSGAIDGTIKVWDTSSGQVIRTIEAHRGWVNSILFTTDGKMLSAGNDSSIYLWDLATGKQTAKFEGWVDSSQMGVDRHIGAVKWLALTRDGRVISAGKDSYLMVWELASCKLQRTLYGHQGEVNGVTVLPDGNVASVSADLTIKIWNPDDGQMLQSLTGHTSAVQAVTLLEPGGDIVSASSDRTIRIWDRATGLPRQCLVSRSWVSAVASMRDGLIASISGDKALDIWEGNQGVLLTSLELESPIWCLATLAQERQVAIGDSDGHVHFLKLVNICEKVK